MTEQPPLSSEMATSVRPDLNSPRLELLIRALIRLKSDISGVEAQHPVLGSDLSSLCETAITELYSHNSLEEQVSQVGHEDPGIVTIELADTPESVPAHRHGNNPVVSAIDKTGSSLITALDKTGDGIIFVLGKLFTNRLSKVNPTTTEGADILNP